MILKKIPIAVLAERLLNNNFKWGPFYNNQNGGIKVTPKKIIQQDWKLDLAIPIAIFALVVVIVTIFVLLSKG